MVGGGPGGYRACLGWGCCDTGPTWGAKGQLASRRRSPRWLGLQGRQGTGLLAEVRQLWGLREATICPSRSLGSARHLRHSQVLPLPAAVPVVSRGHPGEPADIVPSLPASLLKGQLRVQGQLGSWEGCSPAQEPPEPLRNCRALGDGPTSRTVCLPAPAPLGWDMSVCLGTGRAALRLPASSLSEFNRAFWALLGQFLSCLVQLPPLLSTTDILWLSCFCYPLLR